MTLVKQLKSHNLDFTHSLRYYLGHLTEFTSNIDKGLSPLIEAGAWIGSTFWILALVIIAEMISQVEHTNRFLTYASVCGAAVMGQVPQFPFLLSQWALISGLS
jgi:hypothetical protein